MEGNGESHYQLKIVINSKESIGRRYPDGFCTEICLSTTTTAYLTLRFSQYLIPDHPVYVVRRHAAQKDLC